MLRDCLMVVGAALALMAPVMLGVARPTPAAPAAAFAPPLPAILAAVGVEPAKEAPLVVAGVSTGPLTPVSRIAAAKKGGGSAPMAKGGLGSIGQAFGKAVDRQLIYDIVRRHRVGSPEESLHALADVIHAEAVRARLDPLIVASMVAKESSFVPGVVSRAGAVGLMQLLPVVGEEVAERYGIEWRGEASLRDPQTNVRLGILYYKELKQRFAGDRKKALTAYCYGPGWVDKRLQADDFDGSVYADSVLSLYAALSTDRDRRSGEPKKAST